MPAPMSTPMPTQVSAELQLNVPLLTNTNQSVIGTVASFISVGEQTGDFSLISEEKEKNNLTNHMHALFRLKQLLQVWTNCNGMDMWQNSFTKNGIEERLEENWWRGTRQQIRKGIDAKRSSVSIAIKNEFIHKYCAQGNRN